ncbi:MAG: hypothetical protein ACFE9I_16060 [Candidatus Hermodarchaeota archaeon]
MFQSDLIADLLSNPTVIRYIIGGVIVLIVLIVCCAIHRKLVEK